MDETASSCTGLGLEKHNLYQTGTDGSKIERATPGGTTTLMGAAFYLPMHGHTGAPRAARIRQPLNTDAQTINHAKFTAIYEAIVAAEEEKHLHSDGQSFGLGPDWQNGATPCAAAAQQHKSLLNRIIDCLRHH
eukprot:365923-Chlamydomonas_euryale.AAC.5